VLNRLVDNGKQTTGAAMLLDDNYSLLQRFVTLELPYKDNAKNISCIPAGEYYAIVRRSNSHSRHLYITNVKDRTYILFHVANFNTDLRGCIGVGSSFKYINEDQNIDISSSRLAFDELMNHINDKDEITVLITEAMI